MDVLSMNEGYHPESSHTEPLPLWLYQQFDHSFLSMPQLFQLIRDLIRLAIEHDPKTLDES